MRTANRRGRSPRSESAGLRYSSQLSYVIMPALGAGMMPNIWQHRLILLALMVVVDFVEEETALRLERAVIDARRPASIGRRLEALAALALGVVADDQIAGDEIDLFPMVVHERRGGVDARLEAQKPRAAAHLAGLVEIAGKRLLLNARRIARRREPALVHVDALELEMRLVERHGVDPGGIWARWSRLAPQRSRSPGVPNPKVAKRRQTRTRTSDSNGRIPFDL